MSASVRHEEYKDSVPPPGVRQEIRQAVSPEGDRYAGIGGGEPFHTGNIAAHDPGKKQLFHQVPPAGKEKPPIVDDDDEHQDEKRILPELPAEHHAVRPEDDPEFVESVQRIGGRPDEVKHIAGRPITPEDASRIQHLESTALRPTGGGSFAARAQAAAAANLRQGSGGDGSCAATLK